MICKRGNYRVLMWYMVQRLMGEKLQDSLRTVRDVFWRRKTPSSCRRRDRLKRGQRSVQSTRARQSPSRCFYTVKYGATFLALGIQLMTANLNIMTPNSSS